MKVTLKDLDNAWASLATLSEIELPARLSYNIARVTKSIQPEVSLMVEQAQAIEAKYPNGDPKRQSELRELLTTEIELDLKKISPQDLEDSGANIPPSVFIGAWFLFEEE